MKRFLLGLAALLALGLGMADEGTAAPRGTLTIGIPTDINTLDPTMGPEVNSLNVAF
jgi:ABC-type transport system substrate-binding protein